MGPQNENVNVNRNTNVNVNENENENTNVNVNENKNVNKNNPGLQEWDTKIGTRNRDPNRKQKLGHKLGLQN